MNRKQAEKILRVIWRRRRQGDDLIDRKLRGMTDAQVINEATLEIQSLPPAEALMLVGQKTLQDVLKGETQAQEALSQGAQYLAGQGIQVTPEEMAEARLPVGRRPRPSEPSPLPVAPSPPVAAPPKEFTIPGSRTEAAQMAMEMWVNAQKAKVALRQRLGNGEITPEEYKRQSGTIGAELAIDLEDFLEIIKFLPTDPGAGGGAGTELGYAELGESRRQFDVAQEFARQREKQRMQEALANLQMQAEGASLSARTQLAPAALPAGTTTIPGYEPGGIFSQLGMPTVSPVTINTGGPKRALNPLLASMGQGG